jgi:hypothetical protein
MLERLALFDLVLQAHAIDQQYVSTILVSTGKTKKGNPHIRGGGETFAGARGKKSLQTSNPVFASASVSAPSRLCGCLPAGSRYVATSAVP